MLKQRATSNPHLLAHSFNSVTILAPLSFDNRTRGGSIDSSQQKSLMHMRGEETRQRKGEGKKGGGEEGIREERGKTL